jgi:hypothetical protein
MVILNPAKNKRCSNQEEEHKRIHRMMRTSGADVEWTEAGDRAKIILRVPKPPRKKKEGAKLLHRAARRVDGADRNGRRAREDLARAYTAAPYQIFGSASQGRGRHGGEVTYWLVTGRGLYLADLVSIIVVESASEGQASGMRGRAKAGQVGVLVAVRKAAGRK